MTRRVKIIIVIIVLVLVVYLIWLLGGKTKEAKVVTNSVDQAYYETLLKEDAKLKDLVNTNLRIKGLLLDASEATSTPTFTVDQLNLITPKNELAIREYGQKISLILKPYGEPRDNEIALVLEALKNSTPDTLNKLSTTKTLHEQAIDKLLALEVPKDAQVVHLRLINSLSRLAQDMNYMSQVLTEPKLALQTSNNYIKNMVLFFQAIEGVNVYFTKQGIIFGEGENITIYDSLGIVQQN